MITTLLPVTNLILIAIILILTGWLAFITWQLLSLRNHYTTLTKNSQSKNLQQILEEILKSQKEYEKVISEVKSHVNGLEKDGSFHLQKVGFIRFNPFADTGGGQSFVLALLDEHKNGIVFSSLHNREATRIYAKQVIEGKGKEFPLSEEEEQVVHNAQIIKQ